MVTPRLTDGVVVLDAFTLDDVDPHVAGEDEEQARRFGWHPARSTEETVRSAIRAWQEDWQEEGPRRAFALRLDGELVGGCEIRLRERRIAELSYWVFPLHRGRGLATRAVRLACEYAFSHLDVQRLELRIEPDNSASRRVADKAGFVEECLLRSHELTASGERRDMVLYSRLPTDD